MCLLQVDEGPCRGEIERYYYNTITQKCEVFYYGGCQGNANNFRSYQECQKTCFRIPSKFWSNTSGDVTSSTSESYWKCPAGVFTLCVCCIWKRVCGGYNCTKLSGLWSHPDPSSDSGVPPPQRFLRSAGSAETRDPAGASFTATSSTWPPCSVSPSLSAAARATPTTSMTSTPAWSTAAQRNVSTDVCAVTCCLWVILRWPPPLRVQTAVWQCYCKTLTYDTWWCSLGLLSQLSLCSAWILWTKASVRPPFLGITTTPPPRCARSSSTRAAAGAATTSCRGRAARTCVFEVCEGNEHNAAETGEDGLQTARIWVAS